MSSCPPCVHMDSCTPTTQVIHSAPLHTYTMCIRMNLIWTLAIWETLAEGVYFLDPPIFCLFSGENNLQSICFHCLDPPWCSRLPLRVSYLGKLGVGHVGITGWEDWVSRLWGQRFAAFGIHNSYFFYVHGSLNTLRLYPHHRSKNNQAMPSEEGLNVNNSIKVSAREVMWPCDFYL